jgi:hypothetical protein
MSPTYPPTHLQGHQLLSREHHAHQGSILTAHHQASSSQRPASLLAAKRPGVYDVSSIGAHNSLAVYLRCNKEREGAGWARVHVALKVHQ